MPVVNFLFQERKGQTPRDCRKEHNWSLCMGEVDGDIKLSVASEFICLMYGQTKIKMWMKHVTINRWR